MTKIIATLIAATFAVVSTGSFAAAHAGAQPMKDGMKKEEMKKADKPAKKAKSKKSKKAADKK